jgi:NADPH-dependent glutamate synthase beta subunit-like oxidoreductase
MWQSPRRAYHSLGTGRPQCPDAHWSDHRAVPLGNDIPHQVGLADEGRILACTRIVQSNNPQYIFSMLDIVEQGGTT